MLKPKFKPGYIEALVQKRYENIINAMLQRVQYVGETFVVAVRTKINADPVYRAAMRAISHRPKVNISEGTPRYADDTGALTSSVGYQLMINGKVEIVNYNPTGPKAAEGIAAAKKTVAEIAAKHPSGIVLIVVAGMQYAAAVESLGYDVLTGSSFVAEKELKEALQSLTKSLTNPKK